MSNQLLRSMCLLFVTSILAACGNTFQVSTDFDQAYDFTEFRNYTIDTPDGLAHVSDDFAQARIEEALTEQLKARGFVESSADQADMIVSYFSTNAEGTDIETYQSYNSFYSYNTCFHCGGVMVGRTPFPQTEIRTVDYTEGMLMVDFIENGTNTLKWRGQTSIRLGRREADTLSMGERTELASEGVKSILDQFPPGYEPVE